MFFCVYLCSEITVAAMHLFYNIVDADRGSSILPTVVNWASDVLLLIICESITCEFQRLQCLINTFVLQAKSMQLTVWYPTFGLSLRTQRKKIQLWYLWYQSRTFDSVVRFHVVTSVFNFGKLLRRWRILRLYETMKIQKPRRTWFRTRSPIKYR